MSKSLTDLRAEKASQSLPVRVITICLSQALIARVQRLQVEKRGLEIEAGRKPKDEGAGSDESEKATAPQRLGGSDASVRLAEIADELAALYDEMREYEGELLLRAISGGDWQRWKDAHPARDGNATDVEVAFGLCNATDLLDALGKFVAEWNGEPLADSDWDDWFSQKVAPADLRELCTHVVSMHETRVSVPKSLPSSSEIQMGEPG